MDLLKSVRSTILYSNYFNFPLFPEEVHHWLVGSRLVSLEAVTPFVPKMSKANILLRKKLEKYSKQKVFRAKKLVKILSFVPGIRMVALTGSVAAGNSKKGDDIDLLFVTSPHTLWLIRPLVIAIISLFFRRRHPQEDHAHAPNVFCPNLWLDMHSLAIEKNKHSLYTAHEVLQVLPLLNKGEAYERFLEANSWTKKYLANAYNHLAPQKTQLLDTQSLSIVLAPLNYFAYLIQLIYMLPKKTTETVTLHTAFLHTVDYSAKLRHIIT